MSTRKRVPLATLLTALALHAAPDPPACVPEDFNQNWDAATRSRFWFTSQGSQIMPYAWYLALETPWNETLFKDPHVMDDLLGYIASPPGANADGLPIGFAKDVDRETEYVGLTCAACHTARIEVGGVARLVEGGPAVADFWTFLSWLVDALEVTVSNDAKFDRFARRVLGAARAHDAAAKQLLRTKLRQQKDELWSRRDRNFHAEPYGYARVDAFGHILNELLVKDLGIAANRRQPNAPVSYPFLWDTPHHDRVQWNGIAPNTSALGLGPLLRNIGEVVGVFGRLQLRPRFGLSPDYPSSVDKAGLRTLEDLLGSLWSPRWPGNCFPIDAAKAARGQVLYATRCSGCHRLISRTDPSRIVIAQLKPIGEVGTDPTMATNFVERRAATGRLKGTPIRFPFLIFGGFFGTFGNEASGAEILGNAALGIYFGQKLSPPGPVPVEVGRPEAELQVLVEGLLEKAPRYKARPLNGIWATAPYLHNGSVPNLRELLKKPEERMKQFFVGSRKLDPVNVGLSTERDPHRGFLFDTTKPGNLNTGHNYAADLTESARDDLIEYLKQL